MELMEREKMNADVQEFKKIIPENWIKSTIGELMDFSGGSQPPRSTFLFNRKKGYIRLLQIRDYKTDNFITFIPENLAQKVCGKEDIMIGRYGPPIFQILRGLTGAYNVALIKAIPKRGLDKEYAYHFLKQNLLFEFVEKLSQRSSGQTGVDLIQLKNYEFTLPKDIEEQRAIATALSDTDALISSLEKLIAKKKDIKQGAMQQLLTPKNDWDEISLGKSSVLKARIGWQGLTTAEYLSSGHYTLVTGTDFDSGFIKWENCVYVEKERYDQDVNIQLKVNDILVTKDGTIGKVAFIDRVDKPTTLNSGVFVIRPKRKNYDPLFLYYILMSEIFSDFLSKLTAGSTINHLYQKDFFHFSFKAPNSVEEQKSIALVLQTMDKEVKALEAKKAKYEHLKQGMMQELLTGRTRLV